MPITHPRSTLFALALAVLATSCFVVSETRQGSGVPGSETRAVPAFQTIAVAGSADVDVLVGGEPSVRITVDDNLLEYVVTEVEHGTLEIHMQDGYSYDHEVRLRVEIVAPTLEGISIAGSGEMNVRGVQAEHFEAAIAGSGDVRVAGRTDTLEISIAGSGEVDTLALRSRSAEISIAGSGDVLVHASEQLDVSVAGSGDVGYRGDPHVTSSIRGSGAVYRKEGSDV